MKTLTVDDYQRVRLPDAKPRTRFDYQPQADGIIRLVPLVPLKARPQRKRK